MARKKWVYVEGVAHEVTPDYVQPSAERNYDGLLYNDRLYQDDGDKRYTSRATHREYMKANDLAMHSDFTGVWAGAQKQREAVFKGQDPHRRREVERAIYELQNGRGRRG